MAYKIKDFYKIVNKPTVSLTPIPNVTIPTGAGNIGVYGYFNSKEDYFIGVSFSIGGGGYVGGGGGEGDFHGSNINNFGRPGVVQTITRPLGSDFRNLIKWADLRNIDADKVSDNKVLYYDLKNVKLYDNDERNSWWAKPKEKYAYSTSWDDLKNKIEKTERLRLQKQPELQDYSDIFLTSAFPAFANGELYKRGVSGSESFTPLTIYEPYKYFMGKGKADDEFDDILMGRTHFKLAGNKDYYNNVWEVPRWIVPDKSRNNYFVYTAFSRRRDKAIQALNEINKIYISYDHSSSGKISDGGGDWHGENTHFWKIPPIFDVYQSTIKETTNTRGFKISSYSYGRARYRRP